MRIFNIITQKGGTGKSETVKNLAYGLSQMGLRTLVVDLDPQGNTSSTILKLHKGISKKTLDEMKQEYRELISVKKGEATGLEGIEIVHKCMNKKIVIGKIGSVTAVMLRSFIKIC